MTTTYAHGTADARTWTFEYWPLGQVKKLTKPNGITIDYVYENRELLASQDYNDGIVALGTDEFTYHPNRLLKTAHGGLYDTDLDRSVLNTSYDMANRLIQEQCDIGDGLKTLSYTYTADSLISQTTYPGGTQCARTYNAHRLLYEVKIGGTTQATHTYDTADRKANRVYVNGTDTTWDYDANSRITNLAHATTGMMPVTFQEWDYRYTDAGDPLVQDDLTTTAWGEAYQYDGLHRLDDNKRGTVVMDTVPTPTHTQSWTLTKVGDWSSWSSGPVGTPVTETRTHNNIHALTSRSTVANSQTYDTNFNQTDDGTNYTFEYDANDKIQTVRNRATTAVVAEFRYDAQGRRVEKNVGGTITLYYLSGEQIVEERDGMDSTTAFYAYGDYVDEPLLMDRGDRYFYHHNRLYSTYVMTDDMGAIAERYAYTPYGVATTYDSAYANAQSASRIGNPYTFTGRELDGESLLLYYRARTYDPVEGRFKQLDPIGYNSGLSLYEYVSGNPTVGLDATGMQETIESALATNAGSSITAYDQVTFYDRNGTPYVVDMNIKSKFGALFANQTHQFTIPDPKPTISTTLQKSNIFDHTFYGAEATVITSITFTKDINDAAAKKYGQDPKTCNTECRTYYILIKVSPIGVDFSTDKFIEDLTKKGADKIDESVPLGIRAGKEIVKPLADALSKAIPKGGARFQAGAIIGTAYSSFTICADGEFSYSALNAVSYDGFSKLYYQGGFKSNSPNQNLEVDKSGPTPRPLK